MNRRTAPRGSSWTSWSLSILLHLALVAAAAGIWYWTQRTKPPERLQIEGSVVTPEDLAGAPPPPVEPLPEPVEELPAETPVPEEEPPPPEEAPPEEDLAQQQAEAERLVQEQRLAEEKLAAERAEQARQQAEREKAERERRELERAQREKAEREKAEKEKAERERLARERAERERREREQAELASRESELARQLEAERAAARNSAQARQYADLIRARVERAWVRPPAARVGLECEVRVTQVEGGTVTGVRIGRCNGDDSVRQSIEAAVYRASPLPQPPDPALFERELIFNFAPRD